MSQDLVRPNRGGGRTHRTRGTHSTSRMRGGYTTHGVPSTRGAHGEPSSRGTRGGHVAYGVPSTGGIRGTGAGDSRLSQPSNGDRILVEQMRNQLAQVGRHSAGNGILHFY